MAIQSIKHLIVIPKTIDSVCFYINNNLKDGHYRENNDMYFFVAAMLKPPSTIRVHQLIFDHLPFYVDISKNFVEQLTNDEAAQLQELKEVLKKNVMKNLTKAMKERDNKVDENIPRFHFDVQNLLLRTMVSETNYMTRQNETKESEVTKRKKDSEGKIIDFM